MTYTAGLCAHRLRELRRGCRGRWQTRRASAMGYGGSGRLRPSPAPLLPRFPRHPHLLRRRLARLARQRTREGMAHRSRARGLSPPFLALIIPIAVDLRSPALLPRPSHHPRRLQEGFAVRPEDHRGAPQDVAEARDSRAGMPFPSTTTNTADD